jgi:hypothetical protein
MCPIDRSIYRRVDRLQVRFMISFVVHACMWGAIIRITSIDAMPMRRHEMDSSIYHSFSLDRHATREQRCRPGGGGGRREFAMDSSIILSILPCHPSICLRRSIHRARSSENREPDVQA